MSSTEQAAGKRAEQQPGSESAVEHVPAQGIARGNGSHHHNGPGMTKGKLRTAFVLTVLILAVEVAAGLLANSLALLADAGHVVTDLVALGLAWFATAQAERPADARRTYGYHRVGILAALINALTLLLIVAWIAYEAVQRFQHPQTVTPGLMFVAAVVAIAVNLYIGLGLRHAGSENLNVRAAMLHVFGDVAASAAVIVGGIAIVLTGWYPADPLISLAIAVLIARGAWAILRETVDILMEATPRDINVAQLARDVRGLPGICDLHDLHVWSIAGGLRMLSAHVQLAEDFPLSSCAQQIEAINALLETQHHITHATIQLEYAGCSPDGANSLYCMLPSAEASDGKVQTYRETYRETYSDMQREDRQHRSDQGGQLADHTHDGLHLHRHTSGRGATDAGRVGRVQGKKRVQ